MHPALSITGPDPGMNHQMAATAHVAMSQGMPSMGGGAMGGAAHSHAQGLGEGRMWLGQPVHASQWNGVGMMGGGGPMQMAQGMGGGMTDGGAPMQTAQGMGWGAPMQVGQGTGGGMMGGGGPMQMGQGITGPGLPGYGMPVINMNFGMPQMPSAWPPGYMHGFSG